MKQRIGIGSRLGATLLLSTSLGGCGGVSGIDVAARWSVQLVDTLEVTTTIGGGTPTSQLIGEEGTMTSPHYLLIKSPPDETIAVSVTARQGATPLAEGALAVRPRRGEILEVTLDLRPKELP